jgi:hypothetical protein
MGYFPPSKNVAIICLANETAVNVANDLPAAGPWDHR